MVDISLNPNWATEGGVSEDAAWSAFHALGGDDAELDAPLDNDGRTTRTVAQAVLRSYYDERKGKGLQVFPNKTAEANKRRGEFRRNIFLKPLDEVMEPEDAARLEELSKRSSDPDRYKERQILKGYLADRFGGSIPEDQYDRIRHVFARQDLKLTGATDDRAVFAALRDRTTKESEADTMLDGLRKDIKFRTLSSALAGAAVPADPINPVEEWRKVRDQFPEHVQEAAREALFRDHREARELARRVKPTVDKIEGILRGIRDGSANMVYEGNFSGSWDKAGELLPDDPREQALIRDVLAERMKSWGEDERGTLVRSIASGVRGVKDVARGFYGQARASGENFATQLGFPDAEFRQEAGKHFEKVRTLQRLSYSKGDTLRKSSDNFVQTGAILVSQSLSYIAASMNPGGVSFMALSMAGNNYSEAIEANPEAPMTGIGSQAENNADMRMRQLAFATVSGGVEAKIEQATTLLGMKWMKGRFPSLAGAMNRARIASRFGRAAVGAVGTAAAITGIEYSEEVAQAASNRFTQDLALQLSGITPGTDWGQFLADWSPTSPQGQDTLAAVSIFAMIGGGGASFNHFQYGDYLRKNAALMRAVGVPEETIQTVMTTPDVAEADTAIKKAFEKGLETRTAEQRQTFIDTLEAEQKAWAAVGWGNVTEDYNEFTEETAHVFTPPNGAPPQSFENRADALMAWREWAMQDHEAAFDTVQSFANAELLDALTGEGSLSEDTRVEEVDVRLTPGEAVRRGYATQEEMRARLEVFALQQGQAVKDAAKEFETLAVRARRFSEMARDGTVRRVVQLFSGHDPINIIEDLAEDAWTRAMDEGMVDAPQLMQWIREAEEATGNAYLAPDYQHDSEKPLKLIEALSAFSREYALDRVKLSDRFPPAFRQWLDMIVSMAAATFGAGKEIVRMLGRGADLRKAFEGGKLSPKFRDLIEDSIGQNTKATEARMQRRYEDQLSAEAMDGFPEIGAALKGMLPHPDTLRGKNHPLTGEVRRIYDALKTPTRRRRKDGGAVDSTTAANAYFLPVGTMEDLDDIRERMNGKGFEFETPADMLDALDSSLNYGKPVYGTASMGEASFALGRSLVTPSAETQVFPGMDGSPSVIGPATFAISAFHGTPHKVDKFTTAKMGTGEGAQAFGWGLYFAGSFETAEFYRRKLSDPMHREGPVIAAKALIDAGYPDDQILAALGNSHPEANADAALRLAREKDPGNTYKVTLKPSEDELLDWDAPIAEQAEKVREILIVWQKQAGTSISNGERAYREIAFAAQMKGEDSSPAATSATLLAMGIRGIKFLDGNSRSSGSHTVRGAGNFYSVVDGNGHAVAEFDNHADAKSDADARNRGGTHNYVIFSDLDIEILEENGKPVASSSFAVSSKGLARLEAAIAKKMLEGPEERAQYFEGARNRLAAVLLKFMDSEAGIGPFARKASDDPVMQERRRIAEAMAEAQAIIGAFPPEVRGRVRIPTAEILAAKSERGKVNAFKRMIEEADKALELHLRKEYAEAIEKLFDLAKPNLGASRQLAGRLTPATQAKVDEALAASLLTPTQLASEMIGVEAQVAAMEDGADLENPPGSPGHMEALHRHHVLEVFGAINTRSAAEMETALDELKAIYTTGRSQRKVLDIAKKTEIAEWKRETLAELGRPTQAEYSKRTADEGAGDFFDAFRLGLGSFHQVMEDLFPGSAVARDFQDKIRRAERSFTRARLAAKERFDGFMGSAFGATKKSHRDKILAKLSTRRDDWNIQIREGTKFQTEKLTPDQATGVLDGSIKPGWEDDLIAMESLRQALADFRLARRKDQSKAKFVRFPRLVKRGAPSFLHVSDLEALYLLQLAGQVEYLPTLDKHGFTKEVLERLSEKIDLGASRVGDHLAREYAAGYDRINPVFRELYGFNMPRIRNYAPGIFDHTNAKPDTPQDAFGGTANSVNGMSTGFTKSRQHHMARPRQMNALAAYWSHIEQMEYFVSYGVTLREMRAVYRTPDVRRAIEGKRGKRIASLFSQWLDALEVDGRFQATNVLTISEISNNVLATQSAVGLAFNFGTLLKQFSAVTGTMYSMPVRDYVKGFTRVLRNPQSLKKLWETETVQQRIAVGFSPEDVNLMNAARAKPSAILDLLQVGRLPIAWVDATLTTISGSIAYEFHKADALKAGLSANAAEEFALQQFDRAVLQFAQPATTQDKSMHELSLSSHGVGRALIMFKSDPRQKAALAWETLHQLSKGKIGKGEAARKLLVGWVLYGVLSQVAADIWISISRDEERPETWDWKRYLASAIAGPITGITYVGTMLDFGIRKLLTGKAYTNNPSPLDAAAEAAFNMRFVETVQTLMDDKQVTFSDMMDAVVADSRSFALIAGAADPRFAAAAVVPRVIRDISGLVGNTVDLFAKSEGEEKRAILSQVKEKAKESGEEKTEERKDALQSFLKSSPEAQQKQLAQLALTDRRTASRYRKELALRQLPAEERELAKLDVASRAEAIGQFLKLVPAAEQPGYLEKLKAAGIYTKETAEAMGGSVAK
jgi:hypothetical protein